MIPLSLRDKLEIFDISSVSEASIEGIGRQAFVFEYLSVSDRAVFSPVLRKKQHIGYQVKIVKERFDSAARELASKEWFDFEPVVEKANERYSVSINDRNRDPIGVRKISEEDLLDYGMDGFIYRHYLILNVPEGSGIDVESEVYDVLLSVRDSRAMIRGLGKSDLMKYLSTMLEDREAAGTDEEDESELEGLGMNDIDEGVVKKVFHAMTGVNESVWKRVSALVSMLERVIYHKSVSGVTNDVVSLLSGKMWKGPNFFRVGGIYKGGVYVKGLPRADFNVLHTLYEFMESGDSIVINAYPGSYHALRKSASQKKGVSSAYGREEVDETSKEGKEYLQLIVSFNEISPYLLEKKIQAYQKNIGFDFYAQRIVGTMSRYAETVLGTGENRLNLEKAYDSDRLESNLLF